jgi:membrane-associated phospholipid phosphatase
VLIVAAGTAVIAIAGLAQLVLGRHYPSDILCGWLWASAWVVLIARVARRGGPPSR